MWDFIILFTDWFDHKEQKDTWDCHPELRDAYRRRIARLVGEHGVRTIAEEMHWDAMSECHLHKLQHEQKVPNLEQPALLEYINQNLAGKDLPSIAEKVARELSLPYVLCDLGRGDSAPFLTNPFADDQEKENSKWNDFQFRIREEAWRDRLQQIQEKPVLFICGKDHRSSFITCLNMARFLFDVLPEEVLPSTTDLIG